MKKKSVFIVPWLSFLAVLLLVFYGLTCLTRTVVNNSYFYEKGEILKEIDPLFKEVSRVDLASKFDVLFDGHELIKSDSILASKVEVILKSQYPVFYFLSFDDKVYLYFSLILPFAIFLYFLWRDSLEIAPECVLVAEWKGKKMEPLRNGYQFPFRFFNLFREIEVVPVNEQVISIFSGRRDGLSEADVEEYRYGMDSDMEPGSGAALRLKYEVRYKCVDPISYCYNTDDALKYLASQVESRVNNYVLGRTSEEVSDGFRKIDLNDNVFLDLRDYLLYKIGIEIVLFIGKDVLFTPETEASRAKLEEEQRKAELIKHQTDNDAKVEEGRGKFLDKQLENLKKEKNIAAEKNSILTERVVSITNAGVSANEALNFVKKEAVLKAVTEAAKTGGIFYIDENGSKDGSGGKLSDAAALSVAINAIKK